MLPPSYTKSQCKQDVRLELAVIHEYPSYSPFLVSVVIEPLMFSWAQNYLELTILPSLATAPLGRWLSSSPRCGGRNSMGSCWEESLQWKELALSSFLLLAGWKVKVKFGAKVVTEDHDLGGEACVEQWKARSLDLWPHRELNQPLAI